MKKMLLVLLVVTIVTLATGCIPQANTPNVKDQTPNIAPEISTEERQRMDLYIATMKAAFQEENGGNKFVAIKLDTLDGLSDQARKAVLKEFTSLSSNVYSFADVKNDPTKFELDEGGRLQRAIDGTLLWVEVPEYSASKATITGVSWFGNLGAVFPTYEAIYENGKWQLKLSSMAIS